MALRINAGSYQFGCYDGTDHYAVATIPAEDLSRWVHLAGVYDGSRWLLYRDGVLMATRVDPVGAISVGAAWAIAASADGTRMFAGAIGEVRLWNMARTADQVAAVARRWLIGTEPGLVACWRYDGTSLVDVTPAQRPITGRPTTQRRTAGRSRHSMRWQARRARCGVQRALRRRPVDASGDDLQPGLCRPSRRNRRTISTPAGRRRSTCPGT